MQYLPSEAPERAEVAEPGFRVRVLGSRIRVLGVRLEVYGLRFQV